MSKDVLEQVIQRASVDARFRESLQSNFEAAVRTYDLTVDERAQLARGFGAPIAAAAEGVPAAGATSRDAATADAATADAATADAATADAATMDAATADAATADDPT